jgi:peptidoglycan/LPS O-acetylase OafA/YrhL
MTGPTPPTRRDRTRPVELLGLSAIIGVAVGVIVFFSTHNLLTAAEFAGVAFIVSLVVFAMLLLAVSPPRSSDDDQRPSAH